MSPTDLSTLKGRLEELADTFDRKAPTEKALRVWFDTLKEFPTEQVCGVLIGWPKLHVRFPAPAEVWKICNDGSITSREASAAALKAQPVFAPEASPEYRAKCMALIREMLSGPTRSPTDHWRHVLATQPAGSIGHRYATEVLAGKGPSRQREPGEDDA